MGEWEYAYLTMSEPKMEPRRSTIMASITYGKRQITCTCKSCKETEKYKYPVDDKLIEDFMMRHKRCR